MRRRHLLAGALATLTAATLAAPVPAHAAAPVVRQAAATCTSREVLLLMDQSASLQQTDPAGARVDAAQVVVASLSQAGVPVNLGVAGFGSTVTEPARFQLPEQEASATQAVQNAGAQASDLNTDYVLALEAAARYFAAIDAPAECKVLLWFTDGAYDLDEYDPAIAAYSTSTDIATIEAAFESNICGPLGDTSTLDAPVSSHVRDAAFQVDLVDLRTGTENASQQQARADTEQVLRRLYDPADGCSVPGRRVSVSDAGDLVDEFFTQAQIAAGRHPIDCAVLTSGFPMGLTRSVAVRAASPETTLTLGGPGLTVPPTTGTLSHSFTDAERALPGSFTITGGELASCFADVDGAATVVGSPAIYDRATSSLVGIAVGGPGATERPELRLGPEVVTVDTTVDGQPATAAWDPDLSVWQVTVPGPRTGSVTVTATPRVNAVPDDALAPLAQDLAISTTPPAPQVAWTGERAVEGTGTTPSTLRVTPAASTGGTICVTFEPASVPLTGADAATLGSLTMPAEPQCGPDTEPFDVDAQLVVDVERNGAAGAALTYRATYTPPEGGAAQDLGAATAALPQLTLTKPADTARFWLVGLALALASALLAYACLYAFNRRQSRLPDPTRLLRATVALAGGDGEPYTVAEPGSLRMAALRPVVGNRNRYDLPGGLVLRRRSSLNVLAPVAAEARSTEGWVLAVPGLDRKGPAPTTAAVPPRFRDLVVLHGGEHASPAAEVVVPAGTPPTAVEQLVTRALGRLRGRLPDSVSGTSSTPAAAPDGAPRPPRRAPAAPPDAAPPSAAPASDQPASTRRPPPAPPRPGRGDAPATRPSRG